MLSTDQTSTVDPLEGGPIEDGEEQVIVGEGPAPCFACPAVIEAGGTAVRWTGEIDGEHRSIVYHPDCRAAEIALNKLHDNGPFDDWIGLEEMADEDHPWLLADFPGVAARFGITSAAAQDLVDAG